MSILTFYKASQKIVTTYLALLNLTKSLMQMKSFKDNLNAINQYQLPYGVNFVNKNN